MRTSARVAEERDAEAAFHVLRRSITECCKEDHNDDPVLLEAWLVNKTPENVRRWISADGSYAVVAEVDGVVAGFASLLESGEIPLCYIVSEVRFIGVGKALLAGLESIARGLGLRELHLESTKTAHAFYSRNGFKSVGPPETVVGMEGYPMLKLLNFGSNEHGACA